jgi:hypothetical protein
MGAITEALPDPCRGVQSGHSERGLFGRGTPREAASARNEFLFVIHNHGAIAVVLTAEVDGEKGLLVFLIEPESN